MIEDQAIPASIPFLRTNEEQAAKVRKRLEDIFSNISLVHDVIVMSIEVCESNSGDFNPGCRMPCDDAGPTSSIPSYRL